MHYAVGGGPVECRLSSRWYKRTQSRASKCQPLLAQTAVPVPPYHTAVGTRTASGAYGTRRVGLLCQGLVVLVLVRYIQPHPLYSSTVP